MNNPINLHFYDPKERMPEDGEKIILIYIKTGDDPVFYYTDMTLYKKYGEPYPKFYFRGCQTWIPAEGADNDRVKIIAWATFSPEWVIGGVEKWKTVHRRSG